MTNISNLGLTLTLTNSLTSQQTTMSQLSQEIASGQQYSNLTSYDPTQAHNILDFQNAVTQRQSYISSMTNVTNRLSMYDSSLSDIESMAGQANQLATANQTYSASTAANIQQQAANYLKQLTDDLNQQMGGRYIFAGTRYSTKPVVDLTTLTNAPTATTTTSPALPTYDSQYANATSFTVNSGKTPTGTFTMGNTTINWSQLENNNTGTVAVTVNGTTTAVAVSGLSTGNTSADYANNLALTLNAIAGSSSASSAGVPSTLTASASNGAVTLDLGGATPNAVTPDAGGTTGQITWVGGSTPDGTVAQTPNSSTAAYTQDSVLIDNNYSITYGISSNNPSFQQLVNGLRYITSAVTAGQSGDTATYQSDMEQAGNLLSAGLAGVQTIHAQVANNENTIKQETTTQNADITTLQNQLSNIQQVNLSQVGTELNLMQTQLQASYSSTASLEKLSLVTYL